MWHLPLLDEEASRCHAETKDWAKDEVVGGLSDKKEGTITMNFEMMHYLLETYNTEEVISETDAEIMRFVQPRDKA